MSSFKYSTNNTNMGEDARKIMRYSQSVKIGDRIEIAGQGGWNPEGRLENVEISDDLDTEIDQAFANVEHTLKQAGGTGWNQVVKIISLHVGLDQKHTQAMVRNYEKYMPDHYPTWTQYGVAALGHPLMKVEIDVVAYTGN